MKKGSPQAKAWGRKMKALRNRGTTKSRSSSREVTRPMARTRRTRTRARYYSKARRRVSRIGLKPTDMVIGFGIMTLTEPIINGLSARFIPSNLGLFGDDFLKIVGGYYIGKKSKNKIIKATAYAYMGIGVRNLLSGAFSGGLNNLFGANTATNKSFSATMY